jgi:hypothetical protein
MTPQEAAEELGAPVGAIDRRLDEGDFESRVNRDGVLQVLVCLTKRPVIEPQQPSRVMPTVTTLPALVPAMPAVGGTLMPFGPAMSWQKLVELRRARRSARFAWTAAAAMFLVASAAAIYTATLVTSPAPNAPDLSGQLASTSAAANTLASERDTLRAQLAQSNQELVKVQSELVVDRNVEDTLIKAALAAHAAKTSQARSSLLADSSN